MNVSKGYFFALNLHPDKEQKLQNVSELGSPNVVFMVFTNNKNEHQEYANLKELFATSRDVRNELFGSYLAENEIDTVEVQKKVEGKIKTYQNHVQNLKVLDDELKKAVTEQNVEKMLKDVENMSKEQAEVLMEKLRAKLG